MSGNVAEDRKTWLPGGGLLPQIVDELESRSLEVLVRTRVPGDSNR